MALSTQGIYLMKGEGEGNATYSKLVDIKTFPDMGAAPQTVDVTTLSDSMQQFIKGIDTASAMEFTANYDADAYAALSELEEETDFALFFGEEGVNGKFVWKGVLSVWVVGNGVNGVIEMKISIMPTEPVKKLA